MRKPGHREGVRRHQRYGQTTLSLGYRTLDAAFVLPDEDEEMLIGTCQRCGFYWDMRFFKRCPKPCEGEVL